MPTQLHPAEIFRPLTDRSLGFEFEVGLPNRIGRNGIAERLQSAFDVAGVEMSVRVDGYCHTTDHGRSLVQVKTDSSLHFSTGYCGAEIVTPKLSGINAYRIVRIILQTLNAANAKVNKSCGFHLHLGTGDYTLNDYKSLLSRYIRSERRIYSTIAPSRFYGAYCTPLFRTMGREYIRTRTPHNSEFCVIERNVAKVWGCNSLNELYYAIGTTRYTGLNMEPVCQGLRNAIEIRSHQGTTNADKVIAWAEFWLAFVENARNSESRYRAVSETYGNRRAYIANMVSGRHEFRCWQFLNARRQELKASHRAEAMEPANVQLMQTAGIAWDGDTWVMANRELHYGANANTANAEPAIDTTAPERGVTNLQFPYIEYRLTSPNWDVALNDALPSQRVIYRYMRTAGTQDISTGSFAFESIRWVHNPNMPEINMHPALCFGPYRVSANQDGNEYRIAVFADGTVLVFGTYGHTTELVLGSVMRMQVPSFWANALDTFSSAFTTYRQRLSEQHAR